MLEATEQGGATITELLRWAMAALRALPTPRLDAELLLGASLGLSRLDLIRERDRVVPADCRARFQQLVASRGKGQPIAQLRGWQEFWSLELEINEAVLVPRPETELLVTLALEHCGQRDDAIIADLGTGSGAIALALASERPRARILAVERSARALQLAARNRARYARANVWLLGGNWLSALAPACLDLIVANPPYVAEDDPVLTGPGLRFEPRAALAAGHDGLRDLRKIAATAWPALKHGGWLFLEHGATQGAAVRRLLDDAGFSRVCTVKDLAAWDRVTYGQREKAS